jgi:hypothetical protein
MQGCQMVYFQTKDPNLGKFSRVLQWKTLVYFMDVWSIPLTFVVTIWYILWSFGIYFCRFGILNQEKSGSPAGGIVAISASF